MDGGPFRVQRPADRRATGRPEPAPRQSEEPRSVIEESKPVHRAAAPHYAVNKEKSSKRFILPIVAVIVAILLAVGGWFAWSSTQNVLPAVDNSKYQAVFFTNGQVYFGKLKSVGGDYMAMTDVYYLQTGAQDEVDSKNPQQTSEDQNSTTTLVKLGTVEIHGPEDEMVISKDQVLFYENLKPDGKVAQSIEQYKSSQK